MIEDVVGPAFAAALFAAMLGAYWGSLHAAEKRDMQTRFEERLKQERQAEFTRGWDEAWQRARDAGFQPPQYEDGEVVDEKVEPRREAP